MRRRASIALGAALLCLPATLGAYGVGRTEVHVFAGDFAELQVRPAAPMMVVTPERRAWLSPGHAEIPVTLYNVNSRETRTFLLTADGRPVSGNRDELDRFFRCKRSGRRHKMAPQVIAVLADVARHHPGHVIDVVSGYRRRGVGARHSKHYTGHAIDFRVRGVATPVVRDMVWATHSLIGLGHYTGDDFLHVDYRPAEGKIAWTQRREGGNYRYHPAWAGGPPPRGRHRRTVSAP